jgi:hypothetical protein
MECSQASISYVAARLANLNANVDLDARLEKIGMILCCSHDESLFAI